jgi:hypothetical protein
MCQIIQVTIYFLLDVGHIPFFNYCCSTYPTFVDQNHADDQLERIERARVGMHISHLRDITNITPTINDRRDINYKEYVLSYGPMWQEKCRMTETPYTNGLDNGENSDVPSNPR